MNVNVVYVQKGKKDRLIEFGEVDLAETLYHFKERLTMRTNVSIVRQWLAIDGKRLLDDNQTWRQIIATHKPRATLEVVMKDVGPQVAWRTLFFMEYLGPLVVFQLAMLFWLPSHRLSGDIRIGVVYAMVTLHYLKREFETLLVHRFSHDTAPLRALFKNCMHYWVLGGVLFAWELFGAAPRWSFSPTTLALLFALHLICQVGNFRCHLMLRDLRPAGTRTRAIPHGFLFEWVACPNYLFESMSWLVVAISSGTIVGGLFWLVGTAQMYVWAVKKHAAYRKEFGSAYPARRKAFLPFLL